MFLKHKSRYHLQLEGYPIKGLQKILVLALITILTASIAAVIFQQANTPQPSPARFVVKSVDVNPRNVSPGGRITVSTEIKNEGQKNGSARVILSIKDPDGTIRTPQTFNQLVTIDSGSSKTATYQWEIAIDDQQGEHFIRIEVYDINHTRRYDSSEFRHYFTVYFPDLTIEFNIFPATIRTNITVDGATYEMPVNFSWSLASTHTFSVPKTIPIDESHSWIFVTWSDGNRENTRTFTVTYPYVFTAIFAMNFTRR